MSIRDSYETDLIQRAEELHQRRLIFDCHIDVGREFGGAGRALDRDGPGQFDFMKARRGGVRGGVFTIQGPLSRNSTEADRQGRAVLESHFESIQTMLNDFPRLVANAESAEDVKDIARSGRFAAVLGLQNAGPLEGHVDALAAWIDRGVKMVDFTFIGNNAFAESARPYPYSGRLDVKGLTPAGKDALAMLNDRGVIMDVSQMSPEAVHQTAELSRAPIIASHAAAKSKIGSRRNMPDETIKTIAQTGGVVHVVGFGPYLASIPDHKARALAAYWKSIGLEDVTTTDGGVFHPETAKWRDEHFQEVLHVFHEILDLRKPWSGVSDLIDMVECVIDMVGIDHVGLSSDFNGGGGVIGWMTTGETHAVTAELLKRGYSEIDIAKLWGENFLKTWDRIASQARR